MDGDTSLVMVSLPSPKHPASIMEKTMASARTVLRMPSPRLGVI